MSTETPPPEGSKTFRSVIASLVGHVVTVVNPESFEHAPVGHQLKTGFYKAKLTTMDSDFVTLVTEMVKPGKRGEDATKEPVRQYLPIHRIKRISVRKSERLIHI